MIEVSPTEWVEMAWAARNAAHPGMKQEQREWFEGIKCLLQEPDLSKSIVHPPSGVIQLPVRGIRLGEL